jgi:hypothetical protein
MSITTANWEKLDAREELPKLVDNIFGMGFMINEDFILKTCLVLSGGDIKFKVGNFDRSRIQIFEKNWDRISKSIIESFILLESWGLDNSSLRAKNAVIPIIFWIYHNNLENEINNKAKYKNAKEQMRKWLCLSLLKGVFGGQTDYVLKTICDQLKTSNKDLYPLDKIKDAFKSNPSKDLSFGDDFIEGLLTTQKDDPNCYTILSLLYSNSSDILDSKLHKDHLHPESYFKKLKKTDNMSDADFKYYKNKDNWNSIANLQLLNGELNRSKLDTPLNKWIEEKNIKRSNCLIPENISLDIKDFKNFIEKRKEYLRKKFKEITE